MNQEDNLKAAKTAKSAKELKNVGESADADALEAEGRRLLEDAKTAPPGIQVLSTGEYIEDLASGSRVDLRNRGNRLLEQARKMRLAPSKSPESQPVGDEDLDGDWEEIL